ncbi:unnamed protein product [Owenia fusiformis]|uniref:Uncharacterized protein n=1 Tax=Owenia fusiformis TaxID=6347 RepID=A0A8J1U8G1_OWEFU|nr:unnamed protein product [Owenia fusiformis]
MKPKYTGEYISDTRKRRRWKKAKLNQLRREIKELGERAGIPFVVAYYDNGSVNTISSTPALASLGENPDVREALTVSHVKDNASSGSGNEKTSLTDEDIREYIADLEENLEVDPSKRYSDHLRVMITEVVKHTNKPASRKQTWLKKPFWWPTDIPFCSVNGCKAANVTFPDGHVGTKATTFHHSQEELQQLYKASKRVFKEEDDSTNKTSSTISSPEEQGSPCHVSPEEVEDSTKENGRGSNAEVSPKVQRKVLVHLEPGVDLYQTDLDSVLPGETATSNIMDFHIRFLSGCLELPSRNTRTCILPTNLMAMILAGDYSQLIGGFNGPVEDVPVMQVKQVIQIWNKRFLSPPERILLPVCENNHWFLLEYQKADHSIHGYDSLGQSATMKRRRHKHAFNAFQRFLQAVCGRIFPFKEEKMHYVLEKNVPLQQNSVDCGYFVAAFMRDIFMGVPQNITPDITELRDTILCEIRKFI